MALLKLLTGCVVVLALAMNTRPVMASTLNALGVDVGPLGNPFYVALARGAQYEAKKLNAAARIVVVSNKNDLNEDVSAIDTFISMKVNLILLEPADSEAIGPAVAKARAAGIPVVGLDAGANGADINVTTDNEQAGRIACQYLASSMHGAGKVVIIPSIQVKALVDRVRGCKYALKTFPGINVIADNQRGDGSRVSGLNVMQSLLTRFPVIDGMFTINDEMSIGASLAAKSLHLSKIKIVGVDGSPAGEKALKTNPNFIASASQDPFGLGALAVKYGLDLINHDKDPPIVRIPSKLLTHENVIGYKGWGSQ